MRQFELFSEEDFSNGVRVTAPARLHLTLLDMNGSLGRVDGGIGLAIDNPRWILDVKPGDSHGVRIIGATEQEERRLLEYIERLGPLIPPRPLVVRIGSRIPTHVGLGSGTQLGLAIGFARCLMEGQCIDVRQLAEVLGRGGTSGIGVAAFEFGGFILDGGHSIEEKPEFRPSSECDGIRPPRICSRMPCPDWPITLVLPAERHGCSGEEERRHFRLHTPSPLRDVQAACHAVLMQMLPAVLEGDLRLFSRGLSALQTSAWKSSEIRSHGTRVDSLMRSLRIHLDGCAIGMSSMGPAVAVFGGRVEAVRAAVRDHAKETNGSFHVVSTRRRNVGATAAPLCRTVIQAPEPDAEVGIRHF